MADTSSAARLISEDAFSSRANLGQAYNPLVQAAEEHALLEEEDRESLNQPTPRANQYDHRDDATHSFNRPPPVPPKFDSFGLAANKGKGRMSAREEAEDEWEMERRTTNEMRGFNDSTTDSTHRRRSSTSLNGHGHRNVPHSHRRKGSLTPSLTSAEKERVRMLWWRSAFINVLFILAWYTFSTVISVYNKWMFSPDHYNFPYPLFVTTCHMFVQWTCAALTLTAFSSLRPSTKPSPFAYGTQLGPCGVATGLDIGLSNLSLRSITLSFYTMCKSSSLAFVLLFAFLFKLEKPSWRLAGIISIITAGVILMVSTETQFDLTGMIQVLSASAMGGLRWSLTQILLDKENMGMGNPIATLFWLAPIMGITLGTCSIIFDGWGNVFSQQEFFGSLSLMFKTFTAILFPGLIAFLMNVTEFGLIQRTSVVTLSVAGIFKEVAVIFLSMFVFHDQLTPINVSGLIVTLFGIGLYNYLKYKQFTKDPTKASGGHGGRGHGRSRTRDEANHNGFDAVAQESYDEDAPMLSPRARNAERRLGATNDSAIFLNDLEASAPNHTLGNTEDEDFESNSSGSRKSSIEIALSPAEKQGNSSIYGFISGSNDNRNKSSLGLHKQSLNSKLHQHDSDQINDLEERLERDERIIELERQEEKMKQLLEEGIHEHKEPGGWEDLLGEMEAGEEGLSRDEGKGRQGDKLI